MTAPHPHPLPSPGTFAVDAGQVPLEREPLDPALVVSGDPRVGHLAVAAGGDLSVGVWEHTAGVSTDVEADEVFVVLSGRATLEVDDGPTLDLVPGTLCVQAAGTRTRWTVHETLRKVYVVRG